ncbi:MAG TPA: FkbM family methyltransferase [Polyangia bacterium]|jgi:FkbM family methyltransferase
MGALVPGDPLTAAARAFKYVRAFGALRGPLLLLRAARAGGEVRLQLPGFPAPLRLRARTSDVITFEKIFVQDEYDLPYPFEAPGLIVDAGANVGFSAIYLARRFPSARVVALEPERANFAQLVRNTQAYPAILPVQAALWGRSAPVAVANPDEGAWAHWAYRVGEPETPAVATVPGLTVPAVMTMAGADRIDLLKMDVEGAEKEIFASGTEAWLDRVGAICIELHDWIRPGCSTAFYRATSRLEFRQYQRGENLLLVREP